MSQIEHYDQVPYPCDPYLRTHPNRLAVLGTLYGMTPASPTACRVLEIGCANGSNLIPMAVSLPASSFVGIDFSTRQIAEGQQTIAALGLRNIELRTADILQVDSSWGDFDYIVSHGVLSWVPPPVQDKLLAIYAANLRPNGVGFISFNALPGWRMRGIVRDMMCYHAGRLPNPSPSARVAVARQMLDFVAKATVHRDRPYGVFLGQESDVLRQQPDGYVFHEHLEDYNEAFYFREFARRLTAKKLVYLGEAECSKVFPRDLPADVLQALQTVAPDRLDFEQYLDFLRNRLFRTTLVCHEPIRPLHPLRPEIAPRFYVASQLKPKAAQPNLTGKSPEVFAAPSGLEITPAAPIVKAALTALADVWPQALPFIKLLREAQTRLGTSSPTDARELGEAVLTVFTSSEPPLVELWLYAPHFTTRVSDRPVASALVRWQARSATQVTNLRHELVHLNDFQQQLLPLLDGTRDGGELIVALVGRFQEGRLTVAENGQSLTDTAKAREHFTSILDAQLQSLARFALLVG